MTLFARVPVVPGPVLELIKADKKPEFHPSVAKTLYEAPNGTKEGYIYDGIEFSPAPPPAAPTILRQIIQLESQITPRMLREALAGDNTINPKTGKTSHDDLSYINSQIIVLRGQIT